MKLHNLAKMGVVALSIAAASSAFAAKGTAKDSVFNVKVKLLAPLEVTQTGEMDFGSFVAGEDTGAKLVAHTNGPKFHIKGAATYSVTVSVLQAAIEMTTGDGVGPTKRITANGFELWQTGGAQIGSNNAGGSISLGATGEIDVEVGGTANLESNDIAGDYLATNTMRVIYD